MAGLPPIPEPVTEAAFSWFKDVVAPTFIAVITGTLALLGVVASNRALARKDATEHEDRTSAANEKERFDRIQADTAHSDSLTRRFQSLMDGYEGRIRDLTDEVSGLRSEVRSLRQALDKQTRACAGCPVFRSLQEDDDARPTDFTG